MKRTRFTLFLLALLPFVYGYSQSEQLNTLGDLHVSLAISYYDNGEICEADKEFSEAISSYMQAIQIAQTKNENSDYAKQQIDRLHAITDDSAFVQSVITNCIAQNQFNYARKKINAQLKADSTNLHWRFQRGLVSYIEKKFEEALPDFSYIIEKNIQMHTDNLLYYSIRGDIYSNLKEYDQALKDFNKIIELESNSNVAYYNRGMTYKNLGKVELATQDFIKAIELDIDDINAYFELTKIYENDSIKRYDDAINIYNKAQKKWSGNAKIYYYRGYVYKNLKNYDKAIEDWKMAIKFDKSYKKELKLEIQNAEQML